MMLVLKILWLFLIVLHTGRVTKCEEDFENLQNTAGKSQNQTDTLEPEHVYPKSKLPPLQITTTPPENRHSTPRTNENVNLETNTNLYRNADTSTENLNPTTTVTPVNPSNNSSPKTPLLPDINGYHQEDDMYEEDDLFGDGNSSSTNQKSQAPSDWFDSDASNVTVEEIFNNNNNTNPPNQTDFDVHVPKSVNYGGDTSSIIDRWLSEKESNETTTPKPHAEIVIATNGRTENISTLNYEEFDYAKETSTLKEEITRYPKLLRGFDEETIERRTSTATNLLPSAFSTTQPPSTTIGAFNTETTTESFTETVTSSISFAQKRFEEHELIDSTTTPPEFVNYKSIESLSTTINAPVGFTDHNFEETTTFQPSTHEDFSATTSSFELTTIPESLMENSTTTASPKNWQNHAATETSSRSPENPSTVTEDLLKYKLRVYDEPKAFDDVTSSSQPTWEDYNTAENDFEPATSVKSEKMDEMPETKDGGEKRLTSEVQGNLKDEDGDVCVSLRFAARIFLNDTELDLSQNVEIQEISSPAQALMIFKWYSNNFNTSLIFGIECRDQKCFVDRINIKIISSDLSLKETEILAHRQNEELFATEIGNIFESSTDTFSLAMDNGIELVLSNVEFSVLKALQLQQEKLGKSSEISSSHLPEVICGCVLAFLILFAVSLYIFRKYRRRSDYKPNVA